MYEGLCMYIVYFISHLGLGAYPFSNQLDARDSEAALCLFVWRVRAYRKGEAYGGRQTNREEEQAAGGDGEVNGGWKRF